MKKGLLKKLLPEQKTVRYLIATLLLTLGVYFAYPVRGIAATILFASSFLFLPIFWLDG